MSSCKGRHEVVLPAIREDAVAVVLKAAQAAGVGLDRMDLRIEALRHRVGMNPLAILWPDYRLPFNMVHLFLNKTEGRSLLRRMRYAQTHSVGSFPADAESGGSDGFEIQCVEFFGELVQVFGAPRSLGQIYGLLFASPSPLSFGMIVIRLKISKGSASQGLRLLNHLGAVRRDLSSDGRREEFTPEVGLRPLVAGILRGRVEPFLEEGGVRLRRLRQAGLSPDNRAGIEFSLQRIEQLERWRRQIKLLLPVLKTIMGPRPA